MRVYLVFSCKQFNSFIQFVSTRAVQFVSTRAVQFVSTRAVCARTLIRFTLKLTVAIRARLQMFLWGNITILISTGTKHFIKGLLHCTLCHLDIQYSSYTEAMHNWQLRWAYCQIMQARPTLVRSWLHHWMHLQFATLNLSYKNSAVEWTN